MRQPPPNPNADLARAAMQQHNAQYMPLPDDDAFIERVFERWPDMRKYADTARVGMVYDYKAQQWRRHVTVTVYQAPPLSEAARRMER